MLKHIMLTMLTYTLLIINAENADTYIADSMLMHTLLTINADTYIAGN